MKHQALGEHLTDLELRYTVECQCVPRQVRARLRDSR